MALYLFLLTVADQRGLSYYSQPSLMKQLKFGTVRFAQARAELIDSGLIAYEHPLYQVLNLTPASMLPSHAPETKQRQASGVTTQDQTVAQPIRSGDIA